MTLTAAATSSHGRKPSHVWKDDELDYMLQCLGQATWRGIYLADPKDFARRFKMVLNSTFKPSVPFTNEKVKEKMSYVYRKWFSLQHPTNETESSASTSKERSAIQLIRNHMGSLNAIFGDNRSTSLSESDSHEIIKALDYLHLKGCKVKELIQYREALYDGTLRRKYLDLFQVLGVGDDMFKKRRRLFKLMVKEHKKKKATLW
nr:uncharacterized protein LOC127338260 [Lolium perenne]